MMAVFALLQLYCDDVGLMQKGLDRTVKWDIVRHVAGFIDGGLKSFEYDTVMTGNLLNYFKLFLLIMLSGWSKTALKMNWACSFEMSVNNYQSARRHFRKACQQ
jgi:hypothetical protein